MYIHMHPSSSLQPACTAIMLKQFSYFFHSGLQHFYGPYNTHGGHSFLPYQHSYLKQNPNRPGRDLGKPMPTTASLLGGKRAGGRASLASDKGSVAVEALSRSSTFVVLVQGAWTNILSHPSWVHAKFVVPQSRLRSYYGKSATPKNMSSQYWEQRKPCVGPDKEDL